MSRFFPFGVGRCVYAPLWGALVALPAVCAAAPHKAPVAHKAPAPASAKPDTILGVAINADLDDVHVLLARQGVRAGSKPTPGPGSDKDAVSPAGDEDKDADAGEGHKEAWDLKGTLFSQIAIGADGTDRIQWVTAFVRPGQELPFARIKPLSAALGSTPTRVVWSGRSGGDPYALVASGANGKARLLQLFRMPARRYGVNERPPQAEPTARADHDKNSNADTVKERAAVTPNGHPKRPDDR